MRTMREQIEENRRLLEEEADRNAKEQAQKSEDEAKRTLQAEEERKRAEQIEADKQRLESQQEADRKQAAERDRQTQEQLAAERVHLDDVAAAQSFRNVGGGGLERNNISSSTHAVQSDRDRPVYRPGLSEAQRPDDPRYLKSLDEFRRDLNKQQEMEMDR